MNITVDIDGNSGFCAGVIRAIDKAEEFLDRHAGTDGKKLFSLGPIVHNDAELKRLEDKGLVCIDRDDLEEMRDAEDETLLIRAHGEPPQTYVKARAHGFNIVDCTCPVVLKLQKSIREAYERLQERNGQIVIFGKPGHAEVLGLIGQVEGKAVVIENMQMLNEAVESGEIDIQRPVEIFSQTTKSPAEYSAICSKLEVMMADANELSIERFKGTKMFIAHNTICSQVATRHAKLSAFAMDHDIVIFVSGKASSNGKVLCERCKSLNIRTYHIDSPEELKREWFREDDKVGVCGAASTPKWLLEAVAKEILSYN
ncbi:MAG: 4-hydroxy-3-methylbut-2-enyl diphosphate reductase [Bacteroidetes bacterium]|uniref:4-hydroxy-3-methylbut-2-enyl diphosphate reductase n=1 Tax=Candidatus Cryptobacteroides merdavium TaxID=2840769 RepID=A0A9D9EBE9_9BACT|nr:4-hydroxy-3-methylbut-2-enyl diphosphate reductase [Candidatus Cryptobacteroides merdavium]